MVDDRVCGPGFNRLVAAEVAVRRSESSHAGGFACLDVTNVVANINAADRVKRGELAGMKKRVGKGFGTRHGIAADDADAASSEAEGFDDGAGVS